MIRRGGVKTKERDRRVEVDGLWFNSINGSEPDSHVIIKNHPISHWRQGERGMQMEQKKDGMIEQKGEEGYNGLKKVCVWRHQELAVQPCFLLTNVFFFWQRDIPSHGEWFNSCITVGVLLQKRHDQDWQLRAVFILTNRSISSWLVRQHHSNSPNANKL